MNRTSRTGAARGVVGVVVFVVLAFSLFYCSLKRDLLGYHTRDFVFYAQFAAKGFDRSLGADLTLNPEGNNLFGMHGFEGEGGLHRSVHFEPVKYLYAAAYRLTGSLLVLFLITGLILLLPAAYVAVHHRRDGPGDVGFAALAACLYALWPSMVPAIAYDLRPFALLAPLYAMAVLSIQYRRPLAERLLWFNLMFLAREEALVLGIFVWAFALRMERDGDRGRVNLGYGITWAAWAAATAAFYWWMRLDFAFENSPLTLAARLSVADLAVLAAVVLGRGVGRMGVQARARDPACRKGSCAPGPGPGPARLSAGRLPSKRQGPDHLDQGISVPRAIRRVLCRAVGPCPCPLGTSDRQAGAKDLRRRAGLAPGSFGRG